MSTDINQLTFDELVLLDRQLCSELGLVRERMRELELELVHRGVKELQLTGRQREVLGGILAAESNKEIAGRLRIGERTIKFHVSNLLAKTGARNRSELVYKLRSAAYENPLFPLRIDTALHVQPACPSGHRPSADA